MKLEKISEILIVVGSVVAALGLTVAVAAGIAKVIYDTTAAYQCCKLSLAAASSGLVTILWGLSCT